MDVTGACVDGDDDDDDDDDDDVSGVCTLTAMGNSIGGVMSAVAAVLTAGAGCWSVVVAVAVEVGKVTGGEAGGDSP